jgi:D-inositol-3-phosphate glycosyltransferase
VGEHETAERLMVESIIADQSDSIIISTQDEADAIKNIYNISSNKINVIPGGVDLSLFKPKDKFKSKKQLSLTGEKVILAVARLEPLKGLDILISAIYKLENHSGITLLIAGDYLNNKIEFERLQTIISTLNLTENVKFLGNIAHDKMPLYMSAADILVMPSYYESFGLAALEAMACGTPVITSRNSGAKTFITQGTSGYLIPWNCPDPYSERLDILLKNPILRATMGHQATIQANKMSWDTAAAKINLVYNTLIKSA